MDTVEALKQVFMFKDVPGPVLELVARAVDEISVAAGQTIVSPADTPNALYIIRNGTVRVEPGDAPPVLFGTGETIGEVALIDGGPAGGTVIALDCCARGLVIICSFKILATSAAMAEALAPLPCEPLGPTLGCSRVAAPGAGKRAASAALSGCGSETEREPAAALLIFASIAAGEHCAKYPCNANSMSGRVFILSMSRLSK